MNKFTEWLKKRDPELCEGLGILKIVKSIMPGSMVMGDEEGGCGCNSCGNQDNGFQSIIDKILHKIGIAQPIKISQPSVIKGSGPNKKSALENALKKAKAPKDADAVLIDKDNDIYTFRLK